MPKGTVLIIEDDSDITELVALYMDRNGYHSIASDGWDAIVLLQREKVDAILLDVMLNGANGLELCTELRKISDVPILFMSAKAEGADRIAGLELGADDYISKPFNPNEVVARVAAHIRRYRSLKSTTETQSPQIMHIADLEIDQESFTVRCAGKVNYLSLKEFQILLLMVQNPDHIFKPDELYQSVWKSDAAGDVRTVMVHISNLRRKLELNPAHPKYIVTIRGMGYKFMMEQQGIHGA